MISLGKLIQRARQVNSGMTQAEAARAAGFRSKVWWSQIESGVRTPPAETVARMSRVVGLTPAQLRKADQGEAAAELAELLEIFGPYEADDDDDRALVARIRALDEDQRKALFVLLKVLPGTIPAALVGLSRLRPKRRGVVAAAGAGAAAALVAGALVLWPPSSPGGGQLPADGPERLPRPHGPLMAAPLVPKSGKPSSPRGEGKGVGLIQDDPPGSVDKTPAVGEGSSEGPTEPGGPGGPDDLLPPVLGHPPVPDPPAAETGGTGRSCTVRVDLRPIVRLCIRLPLG